MALFFFHKKTDQKPFFLTKNSNLLADIKRSLDHLVSLQSSFALAVSGPEGTGKSELIRFLFHQLPIPGLLEIDCRRLRHPKELNSYFLQNCAEAIFLNHIDHLSENSWSFLRAQLHFFSKNIKSRIFLSANLPDRASSPEIPQLNELSPFCKTDSIQIPALNKRPEDIAELLGFFLPADSKLRLTEEAKSILTGYHWPGNVRELKQTISGLVAAGSFRKQRTIDADLVRKILFNPQHKTAAAELGHMINSGNALEACQRLGFKHISRLIESAMIAKALDHAGQNVSQAAHFLKIPISTLSSRIKTLHQEIEAVRYWLN